MNLLQLLSAVVIVGGVLVTALIAIVKSGVQPESWSEAGNGRGTIAPSLATGALVVRFRSMTPWR